MKERAVTKENACGQQGFWRSDLACNVGATMSDTTKLEARIGEKNIQSGPSPQKDYFVERDGLLFAGTHLLVEFWQASNLTDVAVLDQMMRTAVTDCDATLLNLHLHHFAPSGGVSGVAVLAESHMSIHTWPERNYAAVDVFMCGGCDPYRSLPAFKATLQPKRMQLTEHKRGLVL